MRDVQSSYEWIKPDRKPTQYFYELLKGLVSDTSGGGGGGGGGVSEDSAFGIPYPRHWNGSFPIWQRGETFTCNNSVQSPNRGGYYADNTIAGSGPGGLVTISKYNIPATEAQTIPNCLNHPFTAMKMAFATAPTSGGGAPTYPDNLSFIECVDNNVRYYAGKTTTPSLRLRTDPGHQYNFYLYAAFATGGSTNSAVCTIAGTGGGVDYTYSGGFEIYYRTALLSTTADGSWKEYSMTIDVDDLSGCTLGTGGSIGSCTLGIAMDYGDVHPGENLYITAVKADEGSVVLPWREWPDGAKWAMASYQYQNILAPVMGIAMSTTTIEVAVPLRATIKLNGPGLTLYQTSPQFHFSTGVTVGSASTIASIAIASQEGALVTLNGFTGLTPGAVGWYYGPGILFGAASG